MPTEAPVTAQDQPATPLDQVLLEHGVPRSLPPELLSFARERGLRLKDKEDDPESGADPDNGNPDPDEGGGQPAGGSDPESFTDFDPSQIPDDADGEWLAKRYGEMNQHFTQQMQEVGEGRREAEESQALIEGLRDPETMPHYLRLLGIDLANPETLALLGVDLGDGGDGLDDLDESDLETEVSQLKQERAQEREEHEVAAEVQALDDLADQELEAIEGQWNRKLDEDEDTFLRREAESNPGRDGLPDYASAAKRLKRLLDQQVQAELKRRQEPGRGGPGGRPGGKALDPTKEEDRLALGAAAAERAMASQS